MKFMLKSSSPKGPGCFCLFFFCIRRPCVVLSIIPCKSVKECLEAQFDTTGASGENIIGMNITSAYRVDSVICLEWKYGRIYSSRIYNLVCAENSFGVKGNIKCFAYQRIMLVLFFALLI